MYVVHFLKFHFFESFIFFNRVWHNTIAILEEDLAVTLMAKLLFVPLFHDSSFVGRVISFLFRFSRIFYGLFAYLLATTLILSAALLWFSAPFISVLAVIPANLPDLVSILAPFAIFCVVFSTALFIHHLTHNPLKRVHQLKGTDDIWNSTKLKINDITWDKLSKSKEVGEIFQNLEIPPKEFQPPNVPVDDKYLQRVVEIANQNQALYLTSGYFWMALIENIPGIDNSLLKQNLLLSDFFGALNYIEHKRNKWRKVMLWDEDFGVKHLKGVNRGWLGAPTPSLDSASVDLTKIASKSGFDDFIGRSQVVSQVVDILSQDKDANVLLVGPAGTGKTSLVNYLAKLIISGDAPKSLATKRLVAIQIQKLLASARTEGDLAQKVKDVFEEVQFLQDIIIYIDEIHNLGIGEAGSSFNLYSLMLPYIESDKFQFIASTEGENYAKILEKNSSFLRLFHKVDLPPATKDETLPVIFEKSIDLAKNRINVTYLSIKILVDLSNKLIHDRVLPDSALSVLEECKVNAKDGLITSEVVKKVLSKRVNVPILELDRDQKDLLLNLEQIIHERMIDQEEAVKKVADTLRRSAASIREQTRPIGSFLFVGPTGVGKTELAKILSQVYFKGEGTFVRFDMSEYQTQESINRLIGTIDNPGQLTETVAQKPYCLLLLDEFEKADPKILTLFLQVLDDGRLTDASGKTVDFTSTIIIATSNAASITIAQGLENNLTMDQLNNQVREELLKVMKPELLNRFDAVVMFKPLSEEDLNKVVKIKLEDLRIVLKEQGYLIEFTPEFVTELGKRGFDKVLGARPLRRVMQDTIEAKLSRMILEGELEKGTPFTAGVDFLN